MRRLPDRPAWDESLDGENGVLLQAVGAQCARAQGAASRGGARQASCRAGQRQCLGRRGEGHQMLWA